MGMYIPKNVPRKLDFGDSFEMESAFVDRQSDVRAALGDTQKYTG